MRTTVLLYTAALSLMTVCTSVCCASVPDEVFSFGQVQIGKTTLAEVQALYGKAPQIRTSRDDGAPIALCYHFNTDNRKTHLLFESGAMGGWERVTMFRISRGKIAPDCTATKGIGAIAPALGLRLGMSLEELKKKTGVPFAKAGNSLRYSGGFKRPATDDERKRLQSAHPGEERYEFDVVVTIEARFENDKLTDFLVRKIESF